MFCNCNKLNDRFEENSFKCDCDTTYPFLIEYNKECVENCAETEYKYLIEEENKCVNNCEDTDYKYLIEDNKCVKKCDDTEYIIEEGNKCIKKEPQTENSKEKLTSNDESSNSQLSSDQHIYESSDCEYDDSNSSNSKYLKYDLLFIFIFLFLQI